MEKDSSVIQTEKLSSYQLKKLHELREKEWIAGNKKLLAM